MPIRVIHTPDKQSRGDNTCSICGHHFRGEPIQRLGWIDHEGFFDICHRCATRVGEAVGLVDPQVAVNAAEQLAVVTEDRDQTRELLNIKGQALDAVASELHKAAQVNVSKIQAAYERGRAEASA